jgi:hypothetical protein
MFDAFMCLRTHINSIRRSLFLRLPQQRSAKGKPSAKRDKPNNITHLQGWQ